MFDKASFILNMEFDTLADGKTPDLQAPISFEPGEAQQIVDRVRAGGYRIHRMILKQAERQAAKERDDEWFARQMEQRALMSRIRRGEVPGHVIDQKSTDRVHNVGGRLESY